MRLFTRGALSTSVPSVVELMKIINQKGHRATQRKSLVRNHSFHFGCVSIAYQIAATQLAFTLLVFGRENVAQKRMRAFHFSCCRLLETLGSALVSF
jgi:hypothetical protein